MADVRQFVCDNETHNEKTSIPWRATRTLYIIYVPCTCSHDVIHMDMDMGSTCYGQEADGAPSLADMVHVP